MGTGDTDADWRPARSHRCRNRSKAKDRSGALEPLLLRLEDGDLDLMKMRFPGAEIRVNAAGRSISAQVVGAMAPIPR